LCGPNEGYPECRSADDVEKLLRGPLEILGMSDPPSGTQGAKVLTLLGHDDRGDSIIRAKWRPESSGDALNEPRKELAAEAVQHLFLDEDEVVVPPTVARCFARVHYQSVDPEAPATFPGVDCVFGYLAYWLEDAQSVRQARKSGLLGAGKGIWDARRFESDRSYRDSVANSNLLTYLINHGDAHDEQFVLQSSPRGLRAFVVDNSIAFRSIKNPMLLLREDWSNIQVPALPPKAISRLQRLTPADFARLGNISQLELHDGELQQVTPSEPLPSDGTTMTWDGRRLRVGLTSGEIALVESRVRDLLSRPDLDRLTRH